MRELIVDLTPSCVNRTAIYHIAIDTFKALQAEFKVISQYRGLQVGIPSDRSEEKVIAQAFFEDVPRWAALSVHDDEVRPFSQDEVRAVPRLYFDPIYTLYSDLGPDDVVFVLDLSTLTNPEWHNPTVSAVYERAFRKLMISRAKIVSISDHCSAALRSSFPIPQSDIVTVPLYLRSIAPGSGSPPKFEIEPRKFFLCVGSLEARKNLVGLMYAFGLTNLSSKGWKLAIAGGPGQGHEEIREAAEEIAGVEILGFVPDEELAWLYQNAAAFTYPSFLEGFGLPLLEAMACGLPCLASITGASHEICGDLGVLVDPYHVPSIVDGLFACERMAEEFDEDARERLKRRAATYSFDRYMKALMPVFGDEWRRGHS